MSNRISFWSCGSTSWQPPKTHCCLQLHFWRGSCCCKTFQCFCQIRFRLPAWPHGSSCSTGITVGWEHTTPSSRPINLLCSSLTLLLSHYYSPLPHPESHLFSFPTKKREASWLSYLGVLTSVPCSDLLETHIKVTHLIPHWWDIPQSWNWVLSNRMCYH